jgi:mannosyltransferase
MKTDRSITPSDKLLPAHPLPALRSVARRHTLAIRCILLFGAALLIRLYRLGSQSLWLDEGGTWAEATGKRWPALLAELWGRDAAYPLYHVLLKGWVGLAGDSEWALRLPSALAGAAAVVAVYLAAAERPTTNDQRPTTNDEAINLQPPTPNPQPLVSYPLVAALLFAISPFALWYAQDAKVYSLLMLVVAIELWALLRALRRGGRAWLLLLAVALVSVFVHRLALLAAAGAALAYLIVWPTDDRRTTNDQRPTTTNRNPQPPTPNPHHPSPAPRIAFGLLTATIAAVGVLGIAAGFSNESRGIGGHIPAGPLEGLWLSLAHFSADRGDVSGMLGLPLVVWMLPCIVLTFWGLGRLLRDVAGRDTAAIVILCMFAAPLILLAAALAITPVYEARYATIAFPAWVLIVAYPFARPTTDDRRPTTDDRRTGTPILHPRSVVAWLVLAVLLLVNAVVLFQPKHGLFSGEPVKEQWRQAIDDLAHQAHPDDLVILHPYFVKPLWDYYAPRVTPDPLPQPVTFPIFAGGFCLERFTDPHAIRDCIQREYNEPYFNQQAFGKQRALLLIAPDHANIVDPPLNPPHDKYGFVGLRFQYAAQERAWPCGGSGDMYIGVEIMCMSFPETYNAAGSGRTPEPAVRLAATFGGELRLRGYSVNLLGGAARPGGALPITLYWEAAALPTRDYTMFLHLCRDCTAPPAAQNDRPPLSGYPPAGRTTQWLVGDPVHDERAIALPADLQPGRYTLLLGVYPAGDPSESARLPVASDADVLGGTRLVLGEVEIRE